MAKAKNTKKQVIAPVEVKNENVKTETKAVEPKKQVIAPVEVIEGKGKLVKKAKHGRVLVVGVNTSNEVSPTTAKIIASFKK